MNVKLLTEHHLEFLRLKGGCTASSESTLVKIPHCWRSHVTAIILAALTNLTFCMLNNHLGKSIRESNHASGVCKGHLWNAITVLC